MDWSNKEQVLKKVSTSGNFLYKASKELKDDKDVVLKAVSQNGFALMYASKKLKSDKEVVIAAVLNDEIALKCASEELQNDKELLLLLEGSKEAIKNLTKWYEERMEVLKSYKEQEITESKLKGNLLSITKIRKF